MLLHGSGLIRKAEQERHRREKGLGTQGAPSGEGPGGLTEKSYFRADTVHSSGTRTPAPRQKLPFGGQAGLGLDIWVLWARVQRETFTQICPFDTSFTGGDELILHQEQLCASLTSK